MKVASLLLYTASVDIAFLELEQNLAVNDSQISALGCKSSLLNSAEAMLVGFGRKSVNDSKENFNTNYNLHYGFNKVDGYGLDYVYRLSKNAGKQLINSGDSGSPLFARGNTSTVLGVASTKHLNNRNLNAYSYYAKLSSVMTRKVYKDILKEKNLPVNLEKILRACN